MVGKHSNWYCAFMLGLLCLLDRKVDSGITERPVHIEVKVGDSTHLYCSISNDLAKVSWYHYPVGKGNEELKYIFTDGQMHKPYDQRFRIEKDASTEKLRLSINQVEVEDAGRYVCQNNGDLATAELIVLVSSLVCLSNINPGGLIGPNSCGLEKETIQLSCGINYKGNVPPELQWTRIKHSGYSNSSPGTCDVTNGRINCNHTAEAEFEMNESYFRCQTNRSTTSHYNCKTETIKIPYLTENKTRIAKSIGDAVTCPANVNSFDCSYKWIWYDGDYQETVSESKTLTIDREGLHRCEANCIVKEFKCSINTMTIKASVIAVASGEDTSTSMIMAYIFGGLLLVFFCGITAILIWRSKKKKTWKDARNADIKELKAEIAKLQTQDTMNAEIEELKAEIVKLKSQGARNADFEALKAEFVKLRTQDSGCVTPDCLGNSIASIVKPQMLPSQDVRSSSPASVRKSSSFQIRRNVTRFTDFESNLT